MPWTVADVDKHKKGLSAKQKRKWVAVANSAVAACVKKGGDSSKCEASAIRQANGVTGTKEAESMEDLNLLDELIAQVAELEIEEFDLGEAKYKTVNGMRHPAGDFLVVEDPDKPDTWHLPVKTNGKPDHGLMGGAKAALTAPGGHRGNKYAGPKKAEALRKLKALYKSEGMKWEEAEEAEFDLTEFDFGLSEFYRTAADAFYETFDVAPDGRRNFKYYVRDVFYEHPKMGTGVLVMVEAKPGGMYLVPMKIETDEITFEASDKWKKARTTIQLVKETDEDDEDEGDDDDLGESEGADFNIREARGRVLSISEAGSNGNRRAPLTMEVVIIEPGFGNAKDKHYYSSEMLKKHAKSFEGAKMYATDHNQAEKSVRTEVSIVKAITSFTESGAPVGKVTVFDPNFAEYVRNRADANELETLECSILAAGTARKGKVDGKEAMIVETILPEPKPNVDWVTRAGAGGRALGLSESEEAMGTKPKKEELEEEEGVQEAEPATLQEGEEQPQEGQEQEPELMVEVEVLKVLNEANLPVISRKRLAECTYADKAALDKAIEAEKEYLKEVTGSGKPFGQGDAGGGEARISAEEYAKRRQAILVEYGAVAPESE